MESWFDRGRPALFEALASVCDQIGADIEAGKTAHVADQSLPANLDTECRELDRKRSDAAARELESKRGECLRLERENQDLRNEIARLRQLVTPQAGVAVGAAATGNALEDVSKTALSDVRSKEPRTLGRAPLQDLSTNVPTAKADAALNASICIEVDKLRKEKTSLAAKLEKLDKNYKAVVSQCRKYKAAMSEWMEYALRLESLASELKRRPLVASTPAAPERSSLAPSEPQPSAGEDQGERVEHVGVSVGRPNVDDGAGRLDGAPHSNTVQYGQPADQLEEARSAALQPAAVPLHEAEAAAVQGSVAELEHSVPALHSDSTQGDPADQGCDVASLPPLVAPSSATDVFIKPEPSSDGPVVVSERCVRKRPREDNDEVRQVRIKAEDSDSEPIVLNEAIRSPSPEGSMDLDKVGYHVPTPRKHRRLTRNGRSDSSGPSRGRHVQSHSRAPETSGSVARSVNQGVKTPSHSAVQSGAVSPIQSDNIRLSIERNAGDPLDAAHQSKIRDRSFSEVGELADDGNNYHDTSEGEPVPVDLRENAVRRPSGRLASLLNTSSKPPTWTTPLAGTPISRDTRPNVFDAVPPAPRLLPFGNGGLASKQATPATSKIASETSRITPATSKSAPANVGHDRTASPRTPIFQALQRAGQARAGNGSMATPKSAPASTLRSRPLSSLRREDFKPNPLANSGHDFAFSEVVRNRADRSCLPGCTAPQCCGPYFRALARAQRHASTPEQDLKLMEDYLGDEAWTLRKMTDLDRESVWLEAKTRELANRYGRHRERFDRAQSPPGFWRTDFPSTQEIAQEKAEAAARERDTVEQRYREAMRPGGRWVFRDE